MINWVRGPAVATLGDFAEIAVPAGYRFANTEDAKILLRMKNNPVPPGLAGILLPDAGKGWIVFEYTAIGYVKDDKDNLNASAILKKVEEKVARQNKLGEQLGTERIDGVSWSKEPSYDAESRTMEWAVRAESASGVAVNHIVRILGRQGVLDGIAVQAEQALADPLPLKQLMSRVAFKPGYTYADYQKGDKISSHRLSDLITAEAETEPARASFPWMLIGAGAGGVLVVGAFATWFLVRRKLRVPARTAPMPPAIPRPAQVAAAHHGNGNGNGSNGNGSNGNGANGNGHHKIRRKRVFDYQRYYSDLLFQVSDRAYDKAAVAPRRNGVAPVAAKATNGESNQVTLAANIELIQSQKNLIEEQQRLIREQTKLIEEKTRLIHEKNQVLEKQSELFGNQLF